MPIHSIFDSPLYHQVKNKDQYSCTVLYQGKRNFMTKQFYNVRLIYTDQWVR